MRITSQYLNQLGFILHSSDYIHVTGTEPVHHFLPGMDKNRSLARIIKEENPYSAIFFSNTKVYIERAISRHHIRETEIATVDKFNY